MLIAREKHTQTQHKKSIFLNQIPVKVFSLASIPVHAHIIHRTACIYNHRESLLEKQILLKVQALHIKHKENEMKDHFGAQQIFNSKQRLNKSHSSALKQWKNRLSQDS